jgi:hypothetical protein
MIRFAVCVMVVLLSSAGVNADTWRTLDFPESRSTMITGISGSNLAGNYTDASGVKHGFLFKDNTWTSFDAPTGATSFLVSGIDGSNVVGTYWYGVNSHGFIYDGSNLTTFDLPGTGPFAMTQIYNIDGSNIIGYGNGGYFLYNLSTNDKTIIPGIPCGIDGTNIVGSYNDPGYPRPDDIFEHGFIYDMTTQSRSILDMPGARGTKMWDISGSNIVGWGFLYNLTTDTWTPMNMPGAIETYSQSIDGDNIVGYYSDATGGHGFLYTIPEPCSLLLILAGFTFMRRRIR